MMCQQWVEGGERAFVLRLEARVVEKIIARQPLSRSDVFSVPSWLVEEAWPLCEDDYARRNLRRRFPKLTPQDEK